jgi:putative serine protease PepD
MSEGPGPWSAGNSPAPAPGTPGSGSSDDGPDSGSAGLAAHPAYPIDGPAGPDYSLPPGAFDFGPDPGRPGRGRRWPAAGHGGRRLFAAGLAIALAAALIGGVLGGWIATRAQGAGTSPSYNAGPVPRALTNRPATSVAGVAARVLPSVVMVRVNGGDGTGSGFVVRGGYIVTNNHVVTLDGHASNALLQVVFRNGTTAAGRLVGRDTYSDIAVIKPIGVHGLPALPLGNSSGIDVGDPVIAFGAPLGLAGTVTSGIVSALDRPVQPGGGNGPAAPQVYLQAIQTDAPINPGNSGGPLVNGQGQVIGVNAAFDTLGGDVITGQGGSIGLGFAIPINQARRVSTELIRTGHATHSIIGALLNIRYSGSGAQIATAASGRASSRSGPASDPTAGAAPPGPAGPGPGTGRSGSRAGHPGSSAGRSGSVAGRSGSVAGRPGAAPSARVSPGAGPSGARSGGAAGGTSGAALPVTPGGPASKAGLRPGDVIISLDGQPVTSASTLLDAIRARSPGAPVRLTFLRGGERHSVTLRLGSAPS